MRLFLLILFLCLTAMGCNADPRGRRETALLRAEILDLEDKYYLLKSQHSDALAELQSLKGGNYIGNGEIIYESPTQTNVAPGSTPNGGVNGGGVDNFQLDIQDPGSSSQPAADELPPQSSNRLPAFPSSSVRSRGSNRSQVARLLINRQFSRGKDADGSPGDEGIDVFVQPISRSGTPITVPGELVVKIKDPTISRGDQQIGEWRFLPDETELFFTGDQSGARGILLQLTWDQVMPVGNHVDVFVEFRDSQTQGLQASARIPINPPANPLAGDESLIAGWGSRAGSGSSNKGSELGKGVPAVPASSGSNRIQKPRWRPVR